MAAGLPPTVPVRQGDQALGEDDVVVRAGLMLVTDLERAVLTCHQAWGVFGLSAHGAAGLSLVEVVFAVEALRVRPQLRITPVGRLASAGFPVVPTGKWPHQTILLPGSDAVTLRRVVAVFGPPLSNPSYRPRDSG